MTVYISDTSWQARYYLWADSDDEAWMAMAALGAGDQPRERSANTVDLYAITIEQFADAVALGITITDRFGLAYWCALRDGNTALRERIDAARAR